MAMMYRLPIPAPTAMAAVTVLCFTNYFFPLYFGFGILLPFLSNLYRYFCSGLRNDFSHRCHARIEVWNRPHLS
jgi:hypothetical protein